MANIVTWQERGINLLATKNASKDILIASSHSDMSKTSLYGYIVYVDSALRKECSEGIFVIKYVIYGSVNHLTIFVTSCTHLLEHFHDSINDWIAPLFTEHQAIFKIFFAFHFM